MSMLTRRGAFRQRGMDLPKIQTNINDVDSASSPAYEVDYFDYDADLDLFTQVDYSCLDFLTPTSRRGSCTNSTATNSSTTEAGLSAGCSGGDDQVPWPRPTDRDIHGRSDLNRTAPQWAIHVRCVVSKDFEQDSSSSSSGRLAGWGWDSNDGSSTWAAAGTQRWSRRPSVGLDRRYSYGRKIQDGRGRRPSDFSLRSPPPGMPVHYELQDIPLELVLCSEEDSLYSN
ncbi:hypothetical protein KVR01_007586 [Diaporthe batatas]|uniref:uncharacterized protein n=1 Tax=Diaporthe batatas TaxID=748121 RepID=UPI001D047C2B|nr:uncharacterized protein KVR01_007586 [Diaporthe batatas]KAG8163108.1 hypothetical protein KVR01_007586 [Diaporthe batatas]